MKIAVKITIYAELESDLDNIDYIIEDFENESNYNFSDTPDVRITDMEWRETELIER